MITADVELFYNQLNKTGSLLSIDHGTKKLGIAVSNPEITMAIPIKTISYIAKDGITNTLRSIIQDYKIQAIVIGWPLALDGSQSAQNDIVYKFAFKLQKILKLSIFLQDERFSSKEADNLLLSTGMKRRARNKIDDAISAQLILETCIMSIARLRLSSS